MLARAGFFFGFIPFLVGWEINFFWRERFNFARQRDFLFLVIFCVFVFLGGVFFCLFVFFCFFARSAKNHWLFSGGGMSKTGNSRSGVGGFLPKRHGAGEFSNDFARSFAIHLR